MRNAEPIEWSRIGATTLLLASLAPVLACAGACGLAALLFTGGLFNAIALAWGTASRGPGAVATQSLVDGKGRLAK